MAFSFLLVQVHPCFLFVLSHRSRWSYVLKHLRYWLFAPIRPNVVCFVLKHLWSWFLHLYAKDAGCLCSSTLDEGSSFVPIT